MRKFVCPISKDSPTYKADCIEQAKKFRIINIESIYCGTVQVPYSRLHPWIHRNGNEIYAYMIYYGPDIVISHVPDRIALSFEVTKKEYERACIAKQTFERNYDEYVYPGWYLPTRANWRRNDKYREQHPIPDPVVELNEGQLRIDFMLYPRNVFIQNDEPFLTRKIMSIANKYGFSVSAKAIHFVINKWMNDYNSCYKDHIRKIELRASRADRTLSVRMCNNPNISYREQIAV